MSDIPSNTQPQEETWANTFRHPLLEMRHTVDDVLQVATAKMFLSFRAVCNRNKDSIVVFSESASEVKPKSTGPAPHRGVILTDKHLYIITMPSAALFAPSAGGGCFSWREFGRLCYVKNTPHVVFQFMGGMVALQFSTHREVERIRKVVFSTTGVPPEEIGVNDLDAAKRGGRDLNPSFRGFDLESNSTNARTDRPTPAPSSSGATPVRTSAKVAPSDPSVNTSSPRVGGEGNVDNMLRFILTGAEGGTSYETLYPAAETQTEHFTQNSSVQVRAPTCDRATSPIRFLPDGVRAADVHGIGWGPAQSEDRSDTMSSFSDFDHNDVWRSLHGTPFKREQQAGGSGGLNSTQLQQQASRRRSPAPRQGASSPPAAPAALHSQTSERRIHFDPKGGAHVAMSDDGSEMGSPLQHPDGHIPSALKGSNNNDTLDTENAFGNTVTSVVSGDTLLGGGDEPAGLGRGQSMHQSPPPLRRQQSQRATLAFDSFLGVLAPYRAGLETEGVDSTSKLVKLTEQELQGLMDAAGIAKPGHRTLMVSKVNLAKQARAAKKVISN